jgi:hypothetical protein
MVEIDRVPYTAEWLGTGSEVRYRCNACGHVMGRDGEGLDPFAVWVNR